MNNKNRNQEDKSRFMKCASFFEENWIFICTIISPLLLSIITSQQDYFKENNIIHCFWISIILVTVLSVIMSIINNNKVTKEKERLKTENKELENDKTDMTNKFAQSTEEIDNLQSNLRKLHRELADMTLRNMDRELSLGHNDRVSLYYEKNGSFNILGRHSQNPNINKISSQKFLKNQGVLSKAWEQGEYCDFHCPNYIDKGNSKNKKYFEYQKKNYSYDENVVKQWNMKSSSYIGKAIVKNKKHIGVILYESLGKDKLPTIQENVYDTINEYNDELITLVENGISFNNILSNEDTKTDIEAMNEIKGDSNG